MEHLPLEIKNLYDQALVYQSQGDVYHTVKLFKRITKLAPNWALPFIHLSTIYKYRKDWKAALHYTKKAVALDPSYRTGWWNMGIAATALKKRRIAKRIWNKFGLKSDTSPYRHPIGIKLEYEKQFEIIWAIATDPASAIITSIPHPDSDRKYKDIIVYDEKPSGHTVANGKKYKVFDELEIIKRSRFHTFSVLIFDADQAAIQLLEKLCIDAKMGFENWSNAARSFSKIKLQEYYGAEILANSQDHFAQIAIAAPWKKEVEQLLHSWSVISLKHYSDLVQHL